MKFTEEQLKLYAAPLSETENQKCLNAIGMVRDALKLLGFSDDNKSITKMYEDTLSYSLEMQNASKNRRVKLFIQGSYANNTNVRTQSDVDIAVVQEEIFTTKYRSESSPNPQSGLDYGFVNTEKTAVSFKNEVQACLEVKFGDDVERKNKSIKIHGNSYRKDADAVPCRRYRDYTKDYSKNESNYVGGITITADSSERIINYPEQHIANGRQKNNDTNHAFKKMVRIMKKMRFLMSEQGFVSANKVSSFGLESLLWNIPNEVYMVFSIYRFAFDEILKYLSSNQFLYAYYKEANGIKPLCSSTQDIENYQAFIKDLVQYYEYDVKEA